MVAESSSESASAAAVTVTAWAICQLDAVKVRLAGAEVTSVLSVGSLTVMVTSPAGGEFSTTVYWAVCPSGTVTEVGLMVTPGISSSVIVTVTLSAVMPS